MSVILCSAFYPRSFSPLIEVEKNPSDYKAAINYISAAGDLKKLLEPFCSKGATNPYNNECNKVSKILKDVRDLLEKDASSVLVKYSKCSDHLLCQRSC